MNCKNIFSKRLFYASFLVPLIFTQLIYAQEQFASGGVVELGGNVTFQNIIPVSNGKTGNSYSVFTFAPFIGFFAADGLEIGFNPLGITYVSLSGTSYTQLRILLAPSYNFKTNGNSYPFIEGLLGYTSYSNSESYNGFSWGGRAGVKIGITDSGLLNLGIQYLLITLNPENSSDRNGQNELSISAGFTVWL
jgi:hypothetical protein